MTSETKINQSFLKLKNPAKKEGCILNLVPKGGLEPPQAFTHKNLNLARLPIPPLRHQGPGELIITPRENN